MTILKLILTTVLAYLSVWAPFFFIGWLDIEFSLAAEVLIHVIMLGMAAMFIMIGYHTVLDHIKEEEDREKRDKGPF